MAVVSSPALGYQYSQGNNQNYIPNYYQNLMNTMNNMMRGSGSTFYNNGDWSNFASNFIASKPRFVKIKTSFKQYKLLQTLILLLALNLKTFCWKPFKGLTNWLTICLPTLNLDAKCPNFGALLTHNCALSCKRLVLGLTKYPLLLAAAAVVTTLVTTERTDGPITLII